MDNSHQMFAIVVSIISIIISVTNVYFVRRNFIRLKKVRDEQEAKIRAKRINDA